MVDGGVNKVDERIPAEYSKGLCDLLTASLRFCPARTSCPISAVPPQFPCLKQPPHLEMAFLEPADKFGMRCRRSDICKAYMSFGMEYLMEVSVHSVSDGMNRLRIEIPYYKVWKNIRVINICRKNDLKL